MFRTYSYPVAATTVAVAMLALSASGSAPAAVAEGQTQYRPNQRISYEFGSKFMSGYFEQQAGLCYIVMMVAEKSDPDADVPPASATRLRLPILPGQVIGFDSEEGRSVNLTCGGGADTVIADVGGRLKLMALQALRVPDDIARYR